MRTCLNNGKHEAGFTLLELATIVVILAALASIAIPTFSVWLPNYRLRSAARDLYSNLQMAKLGAVKQNKQWAVVFDQGSDRYYVCSDDSNDGWDGPAAMGGNDNCDKAVDLNNYDDIYFGHAGYTLGVDNENLLSNDDITYANNLFVTFSQRGTSLPGYVYLQNNKDTVYAIGTRPGGVIHLKKGPTWD